MISSMTGYAASQGQGHGYRWSWELRAVNGKGLDLRLRVPDWIEGLEQELRQSLSKSGIKRGNVTCSLRLNREEDGSASNLNPSQLDHVLSYLKEIEQRAETAGVSVSPVTSAEILSIRGVLDSGGTVDDPGPIKAQLLSEAGDLIDAFLQMRQAEGRALEKLLTDQLAELERLTERAAAQAEERAPVVAETLQRNLSKIVDATELEPARITQELAMLAVKSDVTEEIDRLRTHIVSARGLLSDGGAVGRKLDFLMQEFNREANTICAKAQWAALTETGLALKVVIDQMREQVQNVE